MSFINYISNAAMPLIIFLILAYALTERKKAFDIFLEGASEGMKIMINIFPTLIGLFVAISLLSKSGIIDGITQAISPALNFMHFPREIMPLALLRPISGNSSIAVATDIMSRYGVDSNIGLIAATIMGSTETTIYTIAVYSSSIKANKTRLVIIPAIIADFVGIATSIAIYNFK